ncbi:hypothetical protein H0H93_013906 [Arthromyces matolae]|nr:hypothetical protein H0H93_013906 [Arthromyces matolae]
MTKKDIVIIVSPEYLVDHATSDNTTIQKDIKLLFSFKDLTSDDAQRVAYKVANVNYKPGALLSRWLPRTPDTSSTLVGSPRWIPFLEGTEFSTAGYIGALGNKTSWIVTYKPDLTLWISSDGVTGQTLDSISFSNEAIYTWELANNTQVPNNSRWVLYQDETLIYRIKPEAED